MIHLDWWSFFAGYVACGFLNLVGAITRSLSEANK